MKRVKIDPDVEMEQMLPPSPRSGRQTGGRGRPKSLYSIVETKLEDLAKDFVTPGTITEIARGKAKEVAFAILKNEYKDPIAEINKHKWTSFEFNINLHLIRNRPIEIEKAEQVQPITNFNATFNFVHFLTLTGKTKLLSQMNLTDDDLLTPVKVTNDEEDVKRKDSWIFGATALHLAAMYSPEALSVLLHTAKDKKRVMEATNLASKRGVTALHVAAMSPDPFGVHILLKHGADSNARESNGKGTGKGYTPLFYAAKADGIEASYHLLETGSANVNEQGDNGKTALFKAKTYKDVLLLDNYDVDKTIQMNESEKFPEKRTALHYLVDNSYEESPLAVMDCDIFKEDDDHFEMNLEIPYAEEGEDKQTLGLHNKFLKDSRKDLFMHPIMETFLHLKIRKLNNVFNFRVGTNLLLCIVFSLLGFYFTKLYDCKYVDETDEKEDSLDCNHMNDHFSVAENCYYFFDHKFAFGKWFPKFDDRTYFVNKFYGCDAKSKIVKSNLRNSDESEMYPNGTILDIQCYKNHTLRILENGNAHTRYGVQKLLELRGKPQWLFLYHPLSIILYLLLAMRIIAEISDIKALGCKGYLRLDNVMHVLIIVCCIAFLIVAHISVKWAAHVAGITVMFIWIDFTINLGKVIGMGEYIYVVIDVTKKLVSFMILYFPIFCAFAFGLHFANNQSRAYSGMFTSFLRVFVQMTGESEFTSHFQWSPVKLEGGSQTTAQFMYVACTIILTIVVANILIAYTIESTEELKIEGGFIQSEQKVADVMSQFGSKALSWMIKDKSFELRKIGIVWKPGSKGSMEELGFFTYAWKTFQYGGTLPVFDVIEPNVNKETDYYMKEKFMEKFREALNRKEKASNELQTEIDEIAERSLERYSKLKKQLGKMGLSTQVSRGIIDSDDDE